MHGQQPPAGAARTGPIIVLVSGLVLLLAFLAMPVVALGPFSFSAAQLAGQVDQEATLGVLWLVLVAALGIAGVGAWQLFAPSATPGARRAGSLAGLGLSILAVIVYIAMYAIVADKIGSARQFGLSASSVFGAGYWVALLAAIAAGVGAVLALTSTNAARRPGY